MKKRSPTFKIGITGNTCCGKSVVLKILNRLGVSTLDAEETTLNLLVDNPLRISIRLSEHFGSEIIDSRGRLSKKKLVSALTTNIEKKALFYEQADSLMREEIKRFLYTPIGSVIRAVESPMLLETDTQHLYDEVWFIKVDPQVQIQRIQEQERLSEEEAQKVIDSEWPQDRKEQLCSRVIDNSIDLHETELQVKKLLDDIKYRFLKSGL